MKKSGSFLEQHVDKIVLGTIALVSVTILLTMVVRSPNAVQLGTRRVGPGTIDQTVMTAANSLSGAMRVTATPKDYESRLTSFLAVYDSGGTDIREGIRLLNPKITPPERLIITGPFREPPMPVLARPTAGIIRGVANSPVSGLDAAQYSELLDIDLVTVQSSFNPKKVYQDIQTNFRTAPSEFQEPVFAAVELQRQVLREDGRTWTEDWQTVRRTRIDPFAELLDAASLQQKTANEAEILRAQLSTQEVALNLLQPIPYAFLDRQDPWFPPEIEIERLAPGSLDATGSGTRRPTPTTRPIRSTPLERFNALLLTSAAQIVQRDSLVFWAHDDSVEPDKTYRYRLRLGILNPIAGRGSSTLDPELSSKLMFWTDYTPVTRAIDIWGRMYVFPVRMDGEEIVVIEVAKYQMGYWYRKSYDVRPGEAIGRIERRQSIFSGSATAELPDIDYGTGFTLIGIENVTNPRQYTQIKYRDSTGAIMTLPIGRRFWQQSLSARYNDIDRIIRTQGEPVIYTNPGGGGMDYRPLVPTGPGGGYYDE